MFEVGHSKEACAFFVSCNKMKPFIFKLMFESYFYCANAQNINPVTVSHAFLSGNPGMPKTSNLPQINLNQKNREM